MYWMEVKGRCESWEMMLSAWRETYYREWNFGFNHNRRDLGGAVVRVIHWDKSRFTVQGNRTTPVSQPVHHVVSSAFTKTDFILDLHLLELR